jgi:hypothetical protein
MSNLTSHNRFGLFVHFFTLRFLFIFFLLTFIPWQLIGMIPGLNFSYDGLLQLVSWSNTHLFKTYDELILPNGSSDTSWYYSFLKVVALVAVLVALIWTIWKRKSATTGRLTSWFLLMLRYHLIIICFYYGIIKLFALQMPFPSLSMMATPVGELHPMRLSWVFMGYSASYQFFAGMLEVLAGLLLFYRRTLSLGIVLSLFVFGQVLLMNMSFDIPVKIVALQTFLTAMILFLYDSKRYIRFFLLNATTTPSTVFDFPLHTKRQKILRLVAKSVFFLVFFVGEWVNVWMLFTSPSEQNHPIPSGVYEVTHFIQNKDTVDVLRDERAWKDIIFEKDGMGSVASGDSLFRQRYGRGHFKCVKDSLTTQLNFKTVDALFKEKDIFSMQWQQLDKDRYILKGNVKQNELEVHIKNKHKTFPLSNKPFHWLHNYVP